MNTDDFDLEGRQLCPDGACIGVIGPDGQCSICRRAGDPSLPRGVSTESLPDQDAEEAEADVTLVPTGEEPPFEEDRQLCPDGACIGVLGADGRCKVCGRAAGS